MSADFTRAHPNSDRAPNGRFAAGNATAWKPGQHGGGRGRPSRETELAEAARRLTPEALEQLAGVLRDKKAQAIARVRACEIIFERAFGKAPQRIVLETDTAGLDNDALRQFLRQSLLSALSTIDAEPDDTEPAVVAALASPEQAE